MRKFYSFLLATVALLCSTAANAQSFTIDNLNYAILSSTDKTVALTGGSPSGELVIPSTVTYESVDYTVTEVAAGAFQYNTAMTSVTIPATIEYIRSAAFSDCSNVTAFNVAADNATYVSENGVIYTKDMSTIILCPNTTTGVYKIRANVSTIGDCAFDGCTKIEKIIIPQSVSTIGQYAFANCELLTELTIPASVTSLHNTAFGEVGVDNCDNLKEITLLATTPPTWYGAMQILPEDVKINVPAGAKSTYAATYGWTEFTNIVEANGKCGDNAYWTLNEGVLTIFGTGAMYNYNSDDMPWYSNKENITSVTIEEGVTSIGNYAFWECDGLTSIEIPSSVTSIDNYAFIGCDGLTSIVVDEGNTIYDSRGNCNAIIETASNTLIAGCKNTIIPEGITSIGVSAFWRCDGLTSIEIPSSVTSIDNSAFRECDGLTSIVVDEGNSVYDSRNNCNAIIETASNTLITGCKNTVIPNDVTTIVDMAFRYCYGLTSIEIPSSVTSIGDEAFWYCIGLTSIVSHIAAGDLFAPGDYAFGGIDNDDCTLYVPAGAKSTYAATDGWKDFTNIVEFNGKCGDNAFWALNEETGVLTIFGTGAMYNYADNDANRAPWYSNRENITSVTIEEGVTSIGNYAFIWCYGLTSIEIPSSVTSIGNYAFWYCYGLTSIEIPEGVTSIGKYAFYNCYSLTSIEIPSSVTSIGNYAFISCDGLTSIVVDEGNTIYDSRGNCNAIIETASNTLIAGFKNTIIPSSVTNIGSYAFAHCDGLTSIEIPSSVTSIGNSAFRGCDGLTSIVVDEGNSVYDSRGNCNAIIETASNTLIAGCKNTIIPEGVTSIGNSAFVYCYGLTSIEIPSSVTSIGNSAFYYCSGLTSIVSHIAAEDLFAPGNDAFIGIDKNACTLYVPAGAKSTYAATDGWKDFTNIVEFNGKCGDNAYWTLNEGALTIFGTGAIYNYAYNDANRAPWYSNRENITSVTIEEGVTSIGDWVFYNCTILTSIEIPSSVTSIGGDALAHCYGLTSIEIPSSVTSIGQNAFWGCIGLTSIEIPSSVTSISQFAFSNCYGLTSIVVDEGNTIYDSRGNCNAIIEAASNTLIAGCKNTIIPSGVTNIGNYAFSGCYGLTSIEIPNSVTSISEGAFHDCNVLTSIEIPNSVTSIGNSAFYNCSGLTSIEIPSSVTSIGNNAFRWCTGLTSIVSHIAAENLFAPGDYAFDEIDKDACTLYVPAGAKSTYAATNGWKDFTNIVETYDLTVTAAGYATLYLGTAVEIPAGVEAYTAGRIEGNLLKMQAVEDVIPANTAVIIKAEEGTYSFIPSKETPDAIEGNLLRGTLTDTYIKPGSAQTAYVLSKVDGIVGMYRAKLKADGTFKNNANRVYMLLGEINVGEGDLDTSNPGGQLSNGYRFDFSGTTAIEGIESEQQGEAVYYDLSGRRVENPTKGIYIVNGRKVLIK